MQGAVGQPGLEVVAVDRNGGQVDREGDEVGLLRGERMIVVAKQHEPAGRALGAQQLRDPGPHVAPARRRSHHRIPCVGGSGGRAAVRAHHQRCPTDPGALEHAEHLVVDRRRLGRVVGPVVVADHDLAITEAPSGKVGDGPQRFADRRATSDALEQQRLVAQQVDGVALALDLTSGEQEEVVAQLVAGRPFDAHAAPRAVAALEPEDPLAARPGAEHAVDRGRRRQERRGDRRGARARPR